MSSLFFSYSVESTQSPFDISKIPEMLSGQLSPVSSAPAQTEKVHLYSRHPCSVRVAEKVAVQQPCSVDGFPESKSTGMFEIPDHEQSPSPSKLRIACKKALEECSEERQLTSESEKDYDADDRKCEYENPITTESSELITETTTSVSSSEDNEYSRFG